MQFVKENSGRIVIKTPTGWHGFTGMKKTYHNTLLKIKTIDTELIVGVNHIFLTADGWSFAHNLTEKHFLVNDKEENVAIIKIEMQPGGFLYDFLDVDGGSAYIANGYIHHNCEFISSDALLINSIKLSQIQSAEPVYEDMGFKFWREEHEIGGSKDIFLVGVDPATGNDKDYSVIQIFDFPGLKQVGEWRSKEVNIPLLYAKIKWVLNFLSRVVNNSRAEVIWTFERNGIGEAVAALYMNDEKQPEFAELYSEQTGSGSNMKYGVYTGGKTKILACLQLKTLIEKISGGLTINSSMLLNELKNFVARGDTYKAKDGSHDDTVMATVIVIRLLKRLAEYNDQAFDQVNQYIDPTDDGAFSDDAPMGFVM